LFTLSRVGWGRNAILIAVLALLLAGCGGGDDDGDDNAQAPAPGGAATQPQDGDGSVGGEDGSSSNGAQGDEGSGGGSPNFSQGTGGAEPTARERRQAKRRAQREGSNDGDGEKRPAKKRKTGSGQIPPSSPGTGVGITRPDTSKDGADRWKSTARSAYDVAKLVCGSGDSPTDVAKELGLKAREKEAIAREYSAEFPPKFRQAAIEGCLAGLD
jgi:hypothetical protein